VTHSNSVSNGEGGMDRFVTAFATHVAKWTGSHWTFAIVAVFVVVSLLTIGVEDTNIAISIATLLVVFVLQKTQNRDSAALHLKLDEMIHA
jgi:low affinity Fe/Cu permease